MSASVLLQQVSKRFGEVVAVDQVSLAVEAGAFVSLLGPSGCGKTTLLRLVGGFEETADGAVELRLWTSPRSDVPERPFVRAAGYRWVRA